MIPTPSRHPLRRDGTTQAARENAALNPGSGLLDDRDLAHLLTTATRAAELLTFTALNNRADGTWRDFIAGTVPAALAELTLSSSRQLELELAASRPASPTDANLELRAIRLRELCVELDTTLQTFRRGGSPFADTVERVITHQVCDALKAALATATAAHFAEWQQASSILTAAPWQIPFPAAPAPTTVIAAEGGLEGLAAALIAARAMLAASAEIALEAGTADTGGQPPHMALVLAFLELFGVAQAGLDDLVRRHLEFYYTRKLLIHPRGPVMDRSFVLFEPVKGSQPQVVEKGTPLFAGRDSSKADIHFTLVRDATVNAASVAELRATHIRSGDRAMRHATAANSADGLGKDPAPAEGWHPMGRRDLPAARHGCAISAPILRLAGGTKTITITFELASASGLPADLPDSFCTVRYTGPKGWVTISDASRQLTISGNNLVLTLGTLGPEHVFAAYSAKTHARGYVSRFPVVEIELATATATVRGDLLSGREIQRISIQCAVTGDPHLVLANDNGAIDGAKPFQPFGPAPVSKNTGRREEGSHFYIGSQAIFSNRLSNLVLHPKWKDVPEDETGGRFYPAIEVDPGDQLLQMRQKDRPVEMRAVPAQQRQSKPAAVGGELAGMIQAPSKAIEMAASLIMYDFLIRIADIATYRVAAEYLDGSTWHSLDGSHPLFDAAITLNAARFAAKPDLGPFVRPDIGLLRGFVRLTLTTPSDAFGHATYSRRVGDLVLENSTSSDAKKLPPPPVSPSISAITADWTAIADTAHDEGIALFHIEPHGEWKVTAEPTVLPSPEYDGALFIGLRDAAPRTDISLLLHLADGTGDPFVTYPAVDWHYLAGDRWLPLEASAILHDGTYDLRRTGIFTFTVPPDASRTHTRMPTGLLWLRVGANEPLAALNRVHEITAQAGEAVFTPRGNDLSRLAAPLPAGSITRLASPRPGIKKIAQPLASFAGRTEERGPSFYRRVSERLRHRGRAVTVWDYERLVLEKFSGVFLAKCVPHAAQGSELAPGNVLVVVVPKLDGSAAFNPLKPGVSQDQLAEIEAFLQARASGLSTVRVVNPLYEEVRVIAAVALRAGVDETVHRARLNDDLRRLLAPWAYGGAAQFSFTEQVFPSSILNYIEELPYVDYVRDFRVEQTVAGSPTTPARLRPSTSQSILVSAEQHTITRA